MTVRAFEGQPRLTMTPDGLTFVWAGGQIVMDPGLETAVLWSLFSTDTDAPWPGSQVLKALDCGVQTGRFQRELKKAITEKSANNIRTAILYDLNWLIKEGVVESIYANAWLDAAGILYFRVLLIRPKENALFSFSKTGSNWDYQVEGVSL